MKRTLFAEMKIADITGRNITEEITFIENFVEQGHAFGETFRTPEDADTVADIYRDRIRYVIEELIQDAADGWEYTDNNAVWWIGSDGEEREAIIELFVKIGGETYHIHCTEEPPCVATVEKNNEFFSEVEAWKQENL